MRKIISILLALGLVLSFSAIAAPAGAATCTATVVLGNPCAGATSNYTVNFTAPVTLQPGDSLSFDFEDGTTFGTFADGDVKVDGHPVLATKVTVDPVDASKLWVEIPAAATTIYIGATVSVFIDNVKNPGGGTYVLGLDYKESCCEPIDFDCGDYTIKPAKSTYKFVLDFSPTYDGIAEDFVPPFQACGQCGYGEEEDGKWFTNFNITLMYDELGCAGYDPVIINFELTEAPSTTAKASLNLSDDGSTWYSWVLTTVNATSGVGEWGPAAGFAIAANYTETTLGRIHFDTPGDYELCFELEYLGVEEQCTAIPGGILVTRCEPAKVYQWKEAFKIPLYSKWNLISLPFKPFETDIDAMLESFPNADKIMAIWHFDQCADDWFGYPGHGLDAIVDGDSYWMRLPYATVGINYSYGDWWVWGTDRPYEEAPVPFNYEVCEGWNMVGYTAAWNMTACPHVPLSAPDKQYLWNWWDVPGTFADYGMIYGWDAMIQMWDAAFAGSYTLIPGEGYWISFERDGWINP